ncbi:hypothetical protein RJT34_32347 [Clitoria ternatea]|uniref:Uncharacterized protein n=1 Tax=Clitoria ternatea TaxID=43366 RepID=A0AAN9EVV4_CLITE
MFTLFFSCILFLKNLSSLAFFKRLIHFHSCKIFSIGKISYKKISILVAQLFGGLGKEENGSDYRVHIQVLHTRSNYRVHIQVLHTQIYIQDAYQFAYQVMKSYDIINGKTKSGSKTNMQNQHMAKPSQHYYHCDCDNNYNN